MGSEDLQHPAALSKNLSLPVFPGVSASLRESPRFSPLPLFATCVIPAGGPYHAGALNALLPVWRNGRRDRLKICFPQGSGGSSPSTGTTFENREASRFLARGLSRDALKPKGNGRAQNAVRWRRETSRLNDWVQGPSENQGSHFGTPDRPGTDTAGGNSSQR